MVICKRDNWAEPASRPIPAFARTWKNHGRSGKDTYRRVVTPGQIQPYRHAGRTRSRTNSARDRRDERRPRARPSRPTVDACAHRAWSRSLRALPASGDTHAWHIYVVLIELERLFDIDRAGVVDRLEKDGASSAALHFGGASAALLPRQVYPHVRLPDSGRVSGTTVEPTAVSRHDPGRRRTRVRFARAHRAGGTAVNPARRLVGGTGVQRTGEHCPRCSIAYCR